ncbi:hypothetical protein [Schaalia canis]|uniref:SHOCT domain-containing protein n=1 Tax=Schaalia canis TaxID=100469 RepID=A0A3P1SBX9_9ACTO|nr:hypothetical protein [Schaalia canis]RRC94783.1 hypothetical protein EII11_08845 [Schaalia canis]
MSLTSFLPQALTLTPSVEPGIATRLSAPHAGAHLLFNLVEGLVLASLAAGVIAVLWWAAKRYLPAPPSKDLLTRLDENLVNGKVSPEDYARIRAQLVGTHTVQPSPVTQNESDEQAHRLD